MRRFATPTRVFVVGYLLLQVAWIVTVPPFRASDEFDHAYRAAAVAHGQWVADERTPDGRGVLVAAPRDLVEAAEPQCSALPYTGYDNCHGVREAGGADSDLVLVGSGAGTYYPPFYWVVGTAARPFDGATALYAMRVAGALLCAGFVGLAAWCATRSSSRWPLAALLVAASPVLVYSTAVPAPNGLEMTTALALWCALLALCRAGVSAGEQRRLVLVAILAAAVMSSLRLTGPVFVLVVVAMVLAYAPRELWAAVRAHLRLVVPGAAVVAAAAIGFVLWTTGPASGLAPEKPEGSPTFDVLTYLIVWPLQTIAAFPLRNEAGPVVVYAVVMLLAAAFVALALRVGGRRDRVVVVAVTLAVLLLPYAATALTFDSRGVLWQGRYGLPVSVGFVLVAGAVVARRRPHLALRPWLLGACSVLYALGVGACFVKIRHKDLGLPASAGDASWHVPPVALLVVLTVAATALLALAVSRAGVAPTSASEEVARA